VSCLRRHPKNISKCTTKAVPSAKRFIDNAIKTGARQSGAEYGSLYYRICSYDPCPLVHGKVLVYRDGGHLTETFAKRIKPSIAEMLDDKLLGAR
jgi:hypothetical protein